MELTSKINENIKYKCDNNDIDTTDVNHESDVYSIEKNDDKKFIVVFGKQKNDENVFYHNIYNIDINNENFLKIGVFEYKNDNNGDDDDLTKKKGNVLLYDNINIMPDINNEYENKHVIKIIKNKDMVDNPIKKELNSKLTEELKTKINDSNFEVINVVGDGNCFFYTLENALGNYNYEGNEDNKINVEFLRELLSDNLDENTYNALKNEQKTLKNELYEPSTNIKKEKEKMIKEKEKIKKEKELNENQFNEILKSYDEKYEKQFKKDDENAKPTTSQFTNYQETFEGFKNYMKTSEYWADPFSISMLEYLLKIKMIILSLGDDLTNLYVECGEKNALLKEGEKFNPTFYIMVLLVGDHYQSVYYKNKNLFTFKELPENIKSLIKSKCMNGDGIYKKIEDFNK